jgi:hypothetical protein
LLLSVCVCAIDNIYTHRRKRLFTMLTQNIRLKSMLKMVGGNEKGRGNTHDTYNNRTAAADGLNLLGSFG